jgi:hypothetical protein
VTSKNKNSPEIQQDLPLIPPEVRFLSDRYIVKLPLSDPHFKNPWELRLHVAKILEGHLGDTIELTSLKIRRPHFIAKTKARLLKREPYARAYVTLKF